MKRFFFEANDLFFDKKAVILVAEFEFKSVRSL